MDAHLLNFRTLLRDSWTRRAVRMLGFQSGSKANAGKWRGIVKGWRDREWEEKERAYHEISIKQANSVIRRYNSMAPYPVRRTVLTLDRELRSCFADSEYMIETELVRRSLETPSSARSEGYEEGKEGAAGAEDPVRPVERDGIWSAVKRVMGELVAMRGIRRG